MLILILSFNLWVTQVKPTQVKLSWCCSFVMFVEETLWSQECPTQGVVDLVTRCCHFPSLVTETLRLRGAELEKEEDRLQSFRRAFCFATFVWNTVDPWFGCSCICICIAGWSSLMMQCFPFPVPQSHLLRLRIKKEQFGLNSSHSSILSPIRILPTPGYRLRLHVPAPVLH